MNAVARAIAAALLWCGGVAAALAQELSVRQPDGKTVTVIDDKGVGGPFQQWIERRNPDGSLDLAFGRSGRVTLSPDAGILELRSLSLDAQGRLVLAGAAVAADDRATALVSRFLPDGRVDTRWGTQGTSRVASAAGNVRAVDSLALPDQGMLLLGQLDVAGIAKVVLVRLHFDGAADASFGRGGVLHLAPLDGAQPTSLRPDDDGSLLIASQRARDGALLLEAHRWQPGQEGLQLVARQRAPAGWSGPARLERRDGRWQWTDASVAAALPLVAGDNAGSTSAAPLGQAAFNPFASGQASANTEPLPAADGSVLPGPGWLWLVPVAAVLGVATWRRRSARAVDLGLVGGHAATVEAAMTGLAHLMAAPADERSQPRAKAPDGEPTPAVVADGAERATTAPPDAVPRPTIAPPLDPERPTSGPCDDSTGPAPGPRDDLPSVAPGKRDDLKRIKGIGPALEKLLNEQGIFHFRQIAQWQPADVAGFSARLGGFKGRIERDRWVAQAIELSR